MGYRAFCVAAFLAALCALNPTDSRADGFTDLPSGGIARVDMVLDGATLRLADGRDVRLLAIEPPIPLPGVNGPHTLSSRATAELTDLARNHTVEMAFAGPDIDRYGRLWAQVRLVDGVWLQEAMLRKGLARVVPVPAIHALMPEMLAAEDAARKERRGIWATDAFAVRAPGALRAGLGDFLIVEGRVVEVADRKALLALSVAASPGASDEKDERVELLLPRAVQAEFAAVGLAPALARGWRVRARGWLERRDGVPQLLLGQREQLEFIAEEGTGD